MMKQKYITDEIKQIMTKLYEIQKQAQNLLSEYRKILRENRILENRL